MIKLVTFPAAFGLRNVSPFCLKVEMALSYLAMDCDIVEESDPRKSPKGKLPFITCDGETIADSELILEYLDQKSGGKLFAHLSAQQIGEGYAWTRLIEDHLYWLMVASRWLDDQWWPHVKQGFFSKMPFPLKVIVPVVARRQVRQTYELHGLGKHSLAEQKAFALRDFQALDNVLSNQAYILGEDLTVFDFTVASLLAGIVDNKPASWMTDMSEEFPALKVYAERVQESLGVWCRK
ncbi:MAG: glutathione S-transferase family protein [Cellvibrionaceae bacterium]